jgi:UDP-N-acetylmuramyl pentapeptide synthase
MSDKAIAFNNSIDAGEYLKTIISQGDVIYIKGSQSMRMERTVKMILNDPSLAPKLLVRQEKEWLEKK